MLHRICGLVAACAIGAIGAATADAKPVVMVDPPCGQTYTLDAGSYVVSRCDAAGQRTTTRVDPYRQGDGTTVMVVSSIDQPAPGQPGVRTAFENTRAAAGTVSVAERAAVPAPTAAAQRMPGLAAAAAKSGTATAAAAGIGGGGVTTNVLAYDTSACTNHNSAVRSDHWPTRTVDYYTGSGIWPPQPVIYWVLGAAAAWNNTSNQCGFADQANITLNRAGYASATAVVPSYDGVNVVNTLNLSSPISGCGGSTTLACTWWWYGGSNNTLEADIAMATNQPIVGSATPTTYDFKSIMTHEFGHFIGVDHVAAPPLVMNPYTYLNSIQGQYLGAGDVDGMRLLYP